MSNSRLHYLDNLRAFAMIWGIMVHVTTLGDFGWLEIFPKISNNFRMAAFFMVSGYFTGMLLGRGNFSKFITSRSLALGVPLIFGLVALNPITLWMVYNWAVMPVGLNKIPMLVALSFTKNSIGHAFVWHLHLWFLISLLVYALTARPFILGADKIGLTKMLSAWAEHADRKFVPLKVAVVVVLLVLSARGFTAAIGEVLGDVPWLARVTLMYSPYFFLGVLCHRIPAIWESLHRIDIPLILVALVLQVTPNPASNPDGLLGEVFALIKLEMTRCAIIFALLAIFRRLFSTKNAVGALVSQGIYTAYILHYALIYALALLMRSFLPAGSPAQFVVISAIVLVGALALHHFVILRQPLLLFLLNGKVPQAKIKVLG